MKTVKLKLIFDEPHEEHILSATFTDDDLKLLEEFNEYVEELRNTRLAANGLPELKGLHWTNETGFTVVTTDVETDDVYAFLHKLRPLILSQEPASFERTSGLIGKRFANQGLRKQLKMIRNLYQRGEYSGFFQVTVAEMPLFTDEALSQWLNGVEYHRDPEKRSKIKEVEDVISKEHTRSIFLSQLSGKAKAIFLLQDLVQFILGYEEPAGGQASAQAQSHSS